MQLSRSRLVFGAFLNFIPTGIKVELPPEKLETLTAFRLPLPSKNSKETKAMKKMIGLVLVVLILAVWSMPDAAGVLAPMLGVVVTAGMDARQLTQKRGEFLANARALISKAKAAKRDFTNEETLEFEEQMADAEECSAALAAIPHSSLTNYGIDTNTIAGSVAPHDVGGNRTSQPGRVMFRDQDGRDVRAYAHNEPMGEYEPLDAGKLLYAQLTGRFDMLEPHEIVAMGAGSGDGYILTPSYSQRVIDLARSASVVMRAGAVSVNMLNEDLNLLKLTSDPTAQWRYPGNPITATSMTFGMLRLTARTLGVVVPVNIEWLEDSRNGQAVIVNAIQAAMGLALDRAALLGLGAAAEPRGIVNEPNVNAITGVGTPTSYAKMSQAVGDILNANYPGDIGNLAWIMHPRDGEVLDQLQDLNNNPLPMTPWVQKLKQFHTTSLPSTDGGGGNESTQIIGDFSQVVIGIRKRITIRVLDSGTVTDSAGVVHNAASELKRLIVCYLRADTGVLRPTWMTKLTGVTAS